MISFEEAYRIVMDQVTGVQPERVSMMNSLGRILAEEILSDVDMPPFNKSAVDGFACRKSDLDQELEIIETIPAGKSPELALGEGRCSRIMTGAMIPEGSDCVVMVEETEILENGKMRVTGKPGSLNICLQGEDIKAGEKVLSAGTLIKPQHIAVLAAAGAVSPKVSKQLHVGILSTGDELVEPEHLPSLSKIRNTNAYQLAAQVTNAGAIPEYGGIASDTEASLSAMLSDLLDRNEVVLLTGGVSMGDFDYVPKAMENLEIEILFKSVAIQPGRPTVFGKRGTQFIFGLPGNPVSSFVLFEVLVKPFLLKTMGYHDDPEILHLPLGTAFRRKKSERKSLIPVRIVDGLVFPLEYHGSAHINAYTEAQGILTIGIGITELEKEKLQMFDPYNRSINYLRVSITDRCNLRCVYCMPAEGIRLIDHDDIISYEEILDVIREGILLGITKVRITGGEPLVRKGVVSLVEMIARLEGITDFGMTTNGILLDRFADELAKAGLPRVNISLDTIDPDKYRIITRGGEIADVFSGIEAAKRAGISPIKINCVVKNSSLEPDAREVRAFCREHELEVRFIHEMDLETGCFTLVEGGDGGNCKNCNRLRLTANGMIKPCLFTNLQYSIRELGIREALLQAISTKPEKGSVNNNNLFHNIGG